MAKTMQITAKANLRIQGKRQYQSKLRKFLEPEHRGEFVAIEPESGDYYLGQTMSAAYQRAIEAHPQKKFYLVRVGYKTAIRFQRLQSR